MGIFCSGSSQYLVLAAPSPLLSATGYPTTMGAWARPETGTTNGMIVNWGDSGANTNYIGVAQLNSGIPTILATSVSTSSIGVTTAIAARTWFFVLGRFISSTSRRIDVLFADGHIEHAQDTTNKSPSGLDALAIGASAILSPASFYTGSIAEAWWAPADIVGSDVQTNDDVVRQLAWGGPWSIPSVASNVCDYISLRDWIPPTPKGDPLNGVYSKSKSGEATWLNFGPILTDHPPLPYWFARPRESYDTLLI